MIGVAALGALAICALVWSRAASTGEDTVDEQAEAIEANSAVPTAPSIAGAQPTPVEAEASAAPNVEGNAGEDAASNPVDVQRPVIRVPAPSPATPTQPVKATAAPKTAPVPSPAPRPAPPPAPKAVPQPSSASDLYLDRK